MEKSYAKLVTRMQHVTQANAVSAAIENLRRHSCRDVVCCRCENDQESLFQVTAVDVAGSVTEVKCKNCKETSYVCHCQCYCQRNPTQNTLESSYKEQLRNRTAQHNRKSIHICSVMESAVTLLLHSNNGTRVCSCGNTDPHQLTVIGVDRLGFITSVQCVECQKQLDFSFIEESYVVQIMYHGQSDQEAVIRKVLNGDHVTYVDEVCNLLRRHSFYDDSICPEFDSNDRECCRVTAINSSGEVTEVEFDIKDERAHKVQRLQIACRSGCYYHHYNLPSQYELTYKEEVRKRLQAVAGDAESREQTNEIHLQEAVLSCTVLAASATILRRHSIDNKLCQSCKNDDPALLKVIDTDRYGFITRVQCSGPKCQRSMSTACHNSRFYYEEIDESATLERGDHISWHRNLAYWHHAIVTRTDGQTITIAHYGSSGCSVTYQESIKDRQELSISCLSGTAYRITYDDCYTNEYTALRAEKFVGEKQYNPLNRNCEHSTHWCKTGLTRSDQVTTCFSSVGKTALAFGLRMLHVLLLVIFQVIHESREGIQIDRKAFERFEHIITGMYMLLIFLLFSVWSLYNECKKLKPTSENGQKCCCYRPPGVAFGLSIRIITRELFAALGPFLLIWFEDYVLPSAAVWEKQVVISFTLLVVTIVSYVFGAVIGTLLEYITKCCVSPCVTTSTEREVSDQPEREIPSPGNPETNELPFASTTGTLDDIV